MTEAERGRVDEGSPGEVHHNKSLPIRRALEPIPKL
jgi:hypothetical protein